MARQPRREDETAERTRRAMDSFATEFIIQVSTQGSFLGSDRSVTLGYSDEEQHGRHIAELIHPDDLPVVYAVIEEARATPGYRARFGVRARHKSGAWHDVDVTVVDARGRDPLVAGVLIRVRDLTAARGSGDALPSEARRDEDPVDQDPSDGPLGEPAGSAHAEANRFLSLAEALPLGILSADARSYVVFANESACGLFRRSSNELAGSGWLDAVQEDDRNEVRRALQLALDSGAAQKVLFRTGSTPPRTAQARILPLGEGVRTGWIATVEDITERLAFQSDLAHRATHDVLTGLPNRALLEDRLEQAAYRVQRHEATLAVLFLDLDEFKAVNDEHGHDAGDRVIVEVGRRLRATVREVDTVARLGGDEFVVVCEEIRDDEVLELVQRIEAAIREPIDIGDAEVRVGASIGVTTASASELAVADLLRRADRSMYEVKRQNRAAREG